MTNNRSIVAMVAAAAALLAACGDRGQPMAPTAAPIPATMVMVAGDNQEGKAGVGLHAPFVVRVADSQGAGIPAIVVTWSVTSGTGRVRLESEVERLTNFQGLAMARFVPGALGASTVTASLADTPIPPVTFTANATVMVISISPWAVGFFGPDGSPDVTVPVGTSVEWQVDNSLEHILTSIATPPGGASFRSARLTLADQFQFVPHVPGTWEYVCELHASEETGTLTAR